jgi:hypothetical protein
MGSNDDDGSGAWVAPLDAFSENSFPRIDILGICLGEITFSAR